jgi:hypothetical protein
MPQPPTRAAFQTLVLALAIFGMAGALVLTLLPRLFAGSGRPQPPFVLFLLAGLAVIALTVALYAAMGYLGLGFDKSTLVLAAGYNVLIVCVKFVFAPAALYVTNRKESFEDLLGDPNTFVYYAGVASSILFFYLTVFSLCYLFFRRRFRLRRAANATPTSAAQVAVEALSPSAASSDAGLGNPMEQEAARSWQTSRSWQTTVGAARADAPGENRRLLRSLKRVPWWGWIGIAGIVAVFIGSGLWLFPVIFLSYPFLVYLTYISLPFALAIVVALVLALVLAWKTFDRVELQSARRARLGDATLLAGFFWIGLATITLYHVMWVVFLLTLVSIWPFRTYTPK